MMKSNPKAKKPNILLRVLAFLVTAALVLGAAALVAWRDELNLDAFRRWLSYRSIQTSDTGLTEPFTHGGGESLDMACLSGGFLFASSSGAHYYSAGGQELASQILSLERPVLSAGSGAGAVYDAGGSSLFLFRDAGLAFSLTQEQGILSARVNEAGWLTVTGEQSRHRGAVTVYDGEYQPVITLNYSSAFVSDAVLSPDCSTVAVVTVGQSGGSFFSRLELYSVEEEDPFQTVELGGFTVLDMDFDSGGLWLLGESSLITLSPDGASRWEYSFDPAYLKGCDLGGDGFAALLLGDYRAGAARTAVTVDGQGQELGRLELDNQVLSLSAAGRYVALLSGRELEVLTRELDAYARLDDPQGARRAAVSADGSVLLADDQQAWLFLPD